MRHTGFVATLALVAGLAASAPAQAQTAAGGGGGTATPGAPAVAPGAELDLPIGVAKQTVEDEPQKPPSEDEPPKIYDEDIPTKTDSIIFVLDISGSMNYGESSYTGLDGNPTSGTKLERAKMELTRCILGLKDTFQFNIIAFDCDITNWMPARQQATPAMKASAVGWTNRIQARGATGTGPATAKALAEKDNFTVVLLTDGYPNCIGNRDGSMEEHRRMIRAANTQAAVIDVFGIQAYADMEEFCKNVAHDSGGKYIACN
jgi:hypothetical protein